MVFQKRLTHFLVWVACDSLLRKRMLLHSHTHQPIKCKHAFFKYPQVKLWNDTCLQKSPRGGRVSLSGPRTKLSSTVKSNLLLLQKRWNQFTKKLKTQVVLNCWGVGHLTRTLWLLLLHHPGTLFLSDAILQVLGKQWLTLDHYKSLLTWWLWKTFSS